MKACSFFCTFASCWCPELLKGHVVAYLTCVDSKGFILTIGRELQRFRALNQSISAHSYQPVLKKKRGRRNPPSAFI